MGRMAAKFRPADASHWVCSFANLRPAGVIL
jgi:hypothetical protein